MQKRSELHELAMDSGKQSGKPRIRSTQIWGLKNTKFVGNS